MISTDELEKYQDDLTELRNKFLREKGWNYTSSTPGCYWLWEKKFPDGRTVLAEPKLALLIEERIVRD